MIGSIRDSNNAVDSLLGKGFSDNVRTAGKSGKNSDKAAAEFYLNVGVRFTLPDGEEIFVSPFGMALDHLGGNDVTTSNAKMRQLQLTKQKIIEAVQAKCAGLTPGEAMSVAGMARWDIEVRRKGKAYVATGEEGELLPGFDKVFHG